MEALELFVRGSFIVFFFLFLITFIDLLVGSTVFKSQHNRLELLYLRRLIVVILYGRKEVVWKEVKTG